MTTTDYAKVVEKIKQRIYNISKGIKQGWTIGFKDIEGLVGRIDRGQVWTIGGYPGVGKSYFILNLVDNILFGNEEPLKLMIFSTELSPETYIYRHVLMRSGIFKSTFENATGEYNELLNKQLDNYFDERVLNNNSLNIYGDITSFEGIEQVIKSSEKPDIILIDYVQELSIGNMYNKKDTMPLIGAKCKEIATKYRCAVIAVSQMTNASQKVELATSQTAGFDFGKELNNVSHVALALKRNKFANGKFAKHLDVWITKARDGELGNKALEIYGGYKLKEISVNRARELDKEVQL